MAVVVGYGGSVVGYGGSGVVSYDGGGVVCYGGSRVVQRGYVSLVMADNALGGHSVAMSQKTSVGSSQEGAEGYDLKIILDLQIGTFFSWIFFLKLRI